MSINCNTVVSSFVLGFIGGLILLPCLDATVRFTQFPPSVLYVSSGGTARFVWDYHVDDRGAEFQPNSPVWSFIDKEGNGHQIGADDKYTNNWSFVINRPTCPPRLLNPDRVSRQSTATLVITGVSTADNGTYRCSLIVKAGNPIEHQVQLVVTVPPQFNPKPPQRKSITEGQDLSVSCTAIGPPTPNVTWVQGHVTKSTGKRSATLRIPNIRRDQNGTYECQARNNLDENPVTAQTAVVVYYQPSIIPDKFLNKVVNESAPLSIKCDADGNPPPTIKWKTPTGSVHTGNVYNIPSVSRSHAGTYTCTASNGIGTDAMASIQVTVHYPPDIDTSKSNLTAKSWKDNTIRLRCIATGLPAPQISWYKPTNQQITTGVNIVPGGSEVTVLTTADQGDYGQYKCRATNILGSDQHLINITRLFPPGAVNISITDLEASSFTVRWTQPADDGGLKVTGYKVEVSTKPPVITVNTHAVITGLKANTQYTVKVYAQNAAGDGEVSMKVITTMKQGKPSVPQLTLSLDQTNDLSIKLSWTKPDENGGEISKYTIYMKEDGPSELRDIHNISDPEVLEYEMKDKLEYGKTYKFLVTAWNKYGESAKQDESAKTIEIPKEKSKSGEQSINKSDQQEKCSVTALSVCAAFLVVSLVVNILLLLYIWRNIKSKEPTGNTNTNRVTRNQAEDPVYDNALELKESPDSYFPVSDVQQPTSPPGEYEPIKFPRDHSIKISAETAGYTITPTATPSQYQALSRPDTGGSLDEDRGPTYEPLRHPEVKKPDVKKARNNPDTTYQPLGRVKKNPTDYQNLNPYNQRENNRNDQSVV